jgi:hypothetical protein
MSPILRRLSDWYCQYCNILPKFVPVHVGGHVPPMSVSDVFDLPRLGKELGWPILEWHDVKDEKSLTLDDVGCWSVWQAVTVRDPSPRGYRSTSEVHSNTSCRLSIDVSYTSAPEDIKISPGYEHDQHCTFWS